MTAKVSSPTIIKFLLGYFQYQLLKKNNWGTASDALRCISNSRWTRVGPKAFSSGRTFISGGNGGIEATTAASAPSRRERGTATNLCTGSSRLKKNRLHWWWRWIARDERDVREKSGGRWAVGCGHRRSQFWKNLHGPVCPGCGRCTAPTIGEGLTRVTYLTLRWNHECAECWRFRWKKQLDHFIGWGGPARPTL